MVRCAERVCGWVALTIALSGCGTRSDLESGGAGSANAEITPVCSLTGPPFTLFVDGIGQCPSGTSAAPLTGMWFELGDPGVAVQAGAVFSVSPYAGPGAEGALLGPSNIGVPAVSGSLSFTSFVQGEVATGIYDAILQDGTRQQGSFDAVWCPGSTHCQ